MVENRINIYYSIPKNANNLPHYKLPIIRFYLENCHIPSRISFNIPKYETGAY